MEVVEEYNPATEDINWEDYVAEEIEKISGVGIVEIFKMGPPNENGNQTVTVGIRYPEADPSAELLISSFFFNKELMASGAAMVDKDGLPLPDGTQTSIRINKRKMTDFKKAAEVVNPHDAVGKRIGFTYGGRKDDPSRPEWKGFFKPRS